MPIGAVRSEGLTDAYAPEYYPATPNSELYIKTMQIANDTNIKVNSGIIHSVNIYSPYYQETYNPNKYSPDTYKKIGVFGVEMEVSSVFVCSSVKNAKAISILICNRTWEIQDSYRKNQEVNWDKHQSEIKKDISTNNAIKIILETINSL